jgi:hypothetical protein
VSRKSKFARSDLFIKTGAMKRYFKASFEGFAGSGKSYTMGLVARGIWQREGGKPVLVMIDTEESSKFLLPLFEEVGLVEGKHMFVSRSRSLVDFRRILTLAEEEHAVLLIDSLTHIHEEMVRQYLRDHRRQHLTVKDHLVLKPFWKEHFAIPFVRAHCHVLFSGRATWEYEPDRDGETGEAREFYKSGVRMRGDNETAFEPDMTVLMTRRQGVNGRALRVWREALIMKSRYSPLDGKVLKNPTFEDFEPVYRFVMTGEHDRAPGAETPMSGLFSDPAQSSSIRRRHIEVLLGELKGLYDSYLPGTGARERKLKADIAFVAFGRRSWEALERLPLEELEMGYTLAEHLLRQLDTLPEAAKDVLPWLQRQKEAFVAAHIPAIGVDHTDHAG